MQKTNKQKKTHTNSVFLQALGAKFWKNLVSGLKHWFKSLCVILQITVHVIFPWLLGLVQTRVISWFDYLCMASCWLHEFSSHQFLPPDPSFGLRCCHKTRHKEKWRGEKVPQLVEHGFLQTTWTTSSFFLIITSTQTWDKMSEVFKSFPAVFCFSPILLLILLQLCVIFHEIAIKINGVLSTTTFKYSIRISHLEQTWVFLSVD